MTEISHNTRYQLTQALQQLSQAAPNSDVARQAMEVIVKQLEGNLISLNPADSAQLKAALVSATNLQGNLSSGQHYQVKLSAHATNILQFFTTADASTLSTLSLPDPLTQQLLKLPAQQLQTLISATLPPIKTQTNPNIVAVLPATVITHNNKQLVVNFDSLKIPLELSVTTKQMPGLASGDKVKIEISAKNTMWQLTVSSPPQLTPEVSKNVEQVMLSTAAPRGANTASAPNNQPAVSQENSQADKLAPKVLAPPNISINLSPEQAAPLIKRVLSEQATRQNVELTLPVKSLVAQLLNNNVAGSVDLLNKVLGMLPDKIALQIKPSGDSVLLVQHPRLVANLPLTASDIDSLKVLKLSGIESFKAAPPVTDANAPISQSASATGSAQATGSETVKPGQAPLLPATGAQTLSQPAINVDKNPLAPANNGPSTTGEPGKMSAATPFAEMKTLQQLIENNPGVKSLITPQLLNNKAEQSELLQSLLRVSQPKAELASTVLTNLDKMIHDPANFKGASESTTQSWLKQLSQELKHSLPQGNEQDASQIKQLMTAPPLAITSIQLLTPPVSQGMLSGLLTMLQVSLAARLQRNQPSQAERIAQILPALFTDTGKTGNPGQPVRAMQEFAQLEQRHQIMREISRLLAEHQSNKLNNAEKLLQGQETFYYNLPSAFAGEFKNIELLIKRDEQKNSQTEKNETNQHTWQLTMKMHVGELGEVLTKAKLRPEQVEMDFYASNDAVLKQLMNFLPLLTRRLKALGIEVSKSQCQLGKIPETLDQRPYHIFKAKA